MNIAIESHAQVERGKMAKCSIRASGTDDGQNDITTSSLPILITCGLITEQYPQ